MNTIFKHCTSDTFIIAFLATIAAVALTGCVVAGVGGPAFSENVGVGFGVGFGVDYYEPVGTVFGVCGSGRVIA